MTKLAALLLLATNASTAAADSSISGTVKLADATGAAVKGAEVVVYVVGPPADAKPAPRQWQIEQKNRTFAPDLIAITVGDSVIFPNKDPAYHNVFSPKPKFDLGMLRKDEGRNKPQQFDKPGVVDVYCNIHPEMAATILVLPNRYFARVQGGKFEVKNVPPGHWKVFAYARRAAKPVSVDITVPADGKPVVVDVPTITRGVEIPHQDKFGGKYKAGY